MRGLYLRARSIGRSLAIRPRPVVLVLAAEGDPSAEVERRIAASGADTVVCDVRRLTSPDAVTVDRLARIQLIAHRFGRHLELRNASPELIALLDAMGLHGVVPCCDQPSSRGGRPKSGK